MFDFVKMAALGWGAKPAMPGKLPGLPGMPGMPAAPVTAKPMTPSVAPPAPIQNPAVARQAGQQAAMSEFGINQERAGLASRINPTAIAANKGKMSPEQYANLRKDFEDARGRAEAYQMPSQGGRFQTL